MRTFRLTDAAFAALAAGRPDPATVGVLRDAQASRHLLQLREIRRRGGPIPEPIELYEPMAALHTAVTLAALRAGDPLPPARRSADRHLSATHDGLTLRVRLEDTDPQRSALGLTPSGRLSPAQVTEWQELLTSAWRLLTTRHRAAAEIMAAVLRVLVPVEADPGSGGLSATSAEAFGAVAISTPGDPRAFAVGLLHECQHSVLNATTTLFDLVEPGGPRVYSPWRDDPRPLSGLLHGAYAYQSVTRFWRTEAAARIPRPRQGQAALSAAPGARQDGSAHLSAAGSPARTVTPAKDSGPGETGPRVPSAGSGAAGFVPEARPARGGPGELRGRLAEFEFARWRAAVGTAAETLLAAGRLTTAGRRFVAAMRDEVAGMPAEFVEPRVARLAAGANAEHRVRWRLRNLVLPEDALAELLAAWRSGRPAPAVAPARLQTGGGRRLASSERLHLVHDLLGGGERAGRAAAGLRPGDAAYLDGDGGTALSAYGKELALRPADLDLWAGIAVLSPRPAMRARPEVVRQVWLGLVRLGLGLGDAEVDEIAEWLGRSLMSS